MQESSWLKKALLEVPGLWDAQSYWWAFKRKSRAHRGIFDSFAAAAASSPKGKPFGYNQDGIADHPAPAQITTGQELGRFDPRDYPLLVWLRKAFETGTTVFDLGGNIGLGYYAYSRFLQYPANLHWTVCEIEQLCLAGRRIAAERGVKNLEFTGEFGRAAGADIFLSCGTIQFLESSVGPMIAKLDPKPKHVLLQRVALGDHPTFYTLENIGYSYCPYRIQNRAELLGELGAAGYELIDSWRDTKEFKIPFHRDRTVKGYSGLYWRLRGS